MNGKFLHFGFSVLVLILMTTSTFALYIRTVTGDYPRFYDDYMTASSVSSYTWQYQQDNAGARTDSDPDGANWTITDVNTWDVQVVDSTTSPDPGSYLNTNYLRLKRGGSGNTGARASFTQQSTDGLYMEFMVYIPSGSDYTMLVNLTADDTALGTTTPRSYILTRYNGSTYYLDRWNGSSYVNVVDSGGAQITYTANAWQKWIIQADCTNQTVKVKVGTGNWSTTFPFFNAGNTIKGVVFMPANYPRHFYIDAVANYAIMDISWTTVANHPTYRKGGVLAWFIGSPFSIAGAEYPGGASADSYSYETSSNQWMDRLDLPGARAYTQGIELGDDVYICGGRDGSFTFKTDCWKMYYSGGSIYYTSISSLGEATAQHAIGKVSSKIIVAGGVDDMNQANNTAYMNEVKYYDTSYPNNGWQYWDDIPNGTFQGDPLVGRASPTGCGVGTKFYLFGGYHWYLHDDGVTVTWVRMPESHVLNTSAGTWSNISNLPVGRSGASAISYKDRYIFIIGGCTGDAPGGWYEDDVLCYDTVLNSYTTLPTALNYATNDIRTCRYSNYIYAVGGENVDPNHSNTDNHTRKGTISHTQPAVQ